MYHCVGPFFYEFPSGFSVTAVIQCPTLHVQTRFSVSCIHNYIATYIAGSTVSESINKQQSKTQLKTASHWRDGGWGEAVVHDVVNL